jgi:methionine sulfoxide reductase heme-binding subunit
VSENNLRRWLQRNGYRLLVHVVGLGLFAWIGLTYFYGNLGIPARFLMLRSGHIGLIFLVASFACTPLKHFLGWRFAIPMRRPLGLYGFAFSALHLHAYAVLENEMALELIWRDLFEREAMIMGLIAFLLLVPLALTSTPGWQRRLGKRWKRLHRIVYIAIPLAVLHFYWLDRDFKDIPLRFAVVVIVLLALRTSWVQEAIRRVRQRFASSTER